MTDTTKENLKNGGVFGVLLMFGAVLGLFGGRLVFQTEGDKQAQAQESKLARIEERLDQFINIYAGLQYDVRLNTTSIGGLNTSDTKQDALIQRNTEDIKKLFDKVGM